MGVRKTCEVEENESKSEETAGVNSKSEEERKILLGSVDEAQARGRDDEYNFSRHGGERKSTKR